MEMSEPTGTAPPQEAVHKASKARVITMLIVGGVVLAIGGCALFLTNLNFGSGSGVSKDTLSAAGAIIFVAGVGGFLWGCVWGIARFIDRVRPPKPQP